MIKRLFAILLALAMLCTVLAAAAEDAAEGTQQETAVETATEETQEAASEEAAEEVTEEATEAAPPILLLTAYGEEITDQSNDLVSFINDYLSYLSQYGYDVSSPEIQSYIMASSLEYLLEQKVAMHKAADLGLDEISAEERATIEADTASTWEEEIAYPRRNPPRPGPKSFPHWKNRGTPWKLSPPRPWSRKSSPGLRVPSSTRYLPPMRIYCSTTMIWSAKEKTLRKRICRAISAALIWP